MSRVSNLIKNVRKNSGIRFVQPPLFVPAGFVLPHTAKDSVAKQLYQAGIISRDDYDKMLGVVFDTRSDEPEADDFDGEENFDDFDDNFKLSQLAEYYDDFEPSPASETRAEVSQPEQPAKDGDDVLPIEATVSVSDNTAGASE